jgi:putative transposase
VVVCTEFKGADCQSARRIPSCPTWLENFRQRATLFGMAVFHARRLPHYTEVGRPIFLTWRLRGSLPANRYFPSSMTSGQAFVAMDRLLDNARTGPLYLGRPELARMIVEAIRYREGRHYQLHAYVVMANHVHLLITPHVEVSRLMQSLKRFTAREGNRILGSTGQAFWQEESYDRLVRDDVEFRRIARYIEVNPVKAGLAETAEAFPWSSAVATR